MSPMARSGLIVLWVSVPVPALAYLDAGSASLLFQAAAAGLFTGLFLLKTQWANLKAWVSGRKTSSAALSAKPPAAPLASEAPTDLDPDRPGPPADGGT